MAQNGSLRDLGTELQRALSKVYELILTN